MQYIDNTLLASYAACGLKGHLRHKLGLRSRRQDAAPLRLGQAIHLALASHLSGNPISKSFSLFEETYKEWALDTVAENTARSWTNTSQIISHWLLTHPLDELPYEVVTVDGAPVVEKAFARLIYPGLSFVGTLDALVRDKATGLLYVLDHKTTIYDVTPNHERQFQMGSQLTGYLWLAEGLAGDLGLPAINGALINCIQIRPIPASSRKCRAHKLTYDLCGRLHIGSQLLGPYTRAANQTEDWLWGVKTLYGLFQSEETTPTGLFNGSCRFCEYLDFCRKGTSNDAKTDKTLIYEPWEPWKGMEDEDEA